MKRACAALALLFATATHGHEFWIVPSTFVASAGQGIAFELRVGSGWPGEGFARDPRRIVRFELVDSNGRHEIAGLAGADPAGVAAATAPGIALAVYRSNDASVELEAEPFERYLQQEGLQGISEIRAQRGQSSSPAREIYSRCAKAIVTVGRSKAPSGFERKVGLTLELIPERSPTQLRQGEALPVRLLYRDAPLAGALVKALHRSGVQAQVDARTDAQGRASLRLSASGVWLINAVHMVEAPAGSGAEWQSVWSSLSFEIAPPQVAKRRVKARRQRE